MNEKTRIEQTCSNCGKESVYEEGEYESREKTLCKICGHTLSICHFFDTEDYEDFKNGTE